MTGDYFRLVMHLAECVKRLGGLEGVTGDCFRSVMNLADWVRGLGGLKGVTGDFVPVLNLSRLCNGPLS